MCLDRTPNKRGEELSIKAHLFSKNKFFEGGYEK